MTTQFTASQIKLETSDSGENITEIQNYLDTFNKEIEGGDGTATITAVAGKNIQFSTITTSNLVYLNRNSHSIVDLRSDCSFFI